MYMKFEENLYKKVIELTGGDYEKKGDYVPVEKILPMIQDLVCRIDCLKEEQEDFKQQVEDNFKPIPVAEQVGFNERDFY